MTHLAKQSDTDAYREVPNGASTAQSPQSATGEATTPLAPKPLRVVHVGPCFSRGGAENHAIDLARPVRQRFDVAPLPWTPVDSTRRRNDFGFHLPHYTPELVDIVARRYADDLRHFGYEFKSSPQPARLSIQRRRLDSRLGTGDHCGSP